MERRFFFSSLFIAAVLAAACSSAPKKALAPEAPAVEVSTETAEEPDLRGDDFESEAELKPVHFEYDKYELGQDAGDILKANAAILRQKPGAKVAIEGHCDERGTTEYNEALGQNRAREVRNYYIRLGIRGGRLGTISYGKERPLCREGSESCWSQNRRAETKLAAPKGAAPKTQ